MVTLFSIVRLWIKPLYLAESLNNSSDVKTLRLVTLRRQDWCFGSWSFGIKLNYFSVVLVPP